MDEFVQGQVVHSAAEVYETFFLPALFQAWAEPMVAAAGLQPGDRVLDVACGTGVLTRAAAARVAPAGSAVGLDVNPGMLDVARQRAPQIEWRHGRAESLPFAAGHFDAVLSQFGLMFFDDWRRAIQEMARVLRPGGRLAVAVWDSLANTPGYLAVKELLARLFGADVAVAVEAPFCLGDPAVVLELFAGADLVDVTLATREGKATFPSVAAWMFTEVRGWTLAGVMDDAQFDLLLSAAEAELQRFVEPDGRVSFSASAHIVTASRR